MVKKTYPLIEIDLKKCLTPFDCKRCLQICPQAVFRVTEEKVEKGRETDPEEPGAYKLQAIFMDKCSMCGDCLAVCPVDAIKIILPG